jgi:hypothetical protein
MAAKGSLVVALTSFVAGGKSGELAVREGDVYNADDPLVAKHPSLFGPLVVRDSSPRIEQATAAPGEKRGA